MNDNDSITPFERTTPQRLTNLMSPTIDLDAQGVEAHYTLRQVWHVILKRRWTVVTATFIVTVAAAIVSFRMVPVYEASARVEVEGDMGQIMTLNDLYREAPQSDTAVATQMQVLQSTTLAWMTIEQLGLQDNPDFVGGPIQRRQGGTKASLQERTSLVQDFLGSMQVERIKDSRIIRVGFESSNAALAARITNALVNNYIEHTFHQKYDATRQASEWMEQQLDELRAKVEKSQQALVEYERQNLIVNMGGNQSVAEQKMMELTHDLTAAQSERIQDESLYNLVKDNPNQVAFISQNELLQRLEERYADAKAQYADALSQYGPNFPKVVRTREQLNAIQGLIEAERKRVMEKLRNDYLGAADREKLLDNAMSQQRTELSRMSQLMIQHNILKREFDTNQALYENLLQRLKDATVSAGLKASNIRVIDRAMPPLYPIRPRKRQNVAIGMIVGLIMGVTLAFVQEALDSSVRTTEEAERLVSAPALAVIPLARDGSGRKMLPGAKPATPAGANGVPLAVLNTPSSPVAESYRSLRTSVLLSTAPRPPQTVLVTSAQVGEGKTSTALNLAIAFAQRSGPVLIIDADLRRPAVARSLGVASEKGLSSYLTGAHSLDEVLIQYESVPNLWILPAGPRTPDPAELLSSPTMESTLKGMLSRFTHIIVDTPPLLLVTDAVVLSPLVDGVILVVASGVTARGALTRAHRILENAGTRVLGMVLNKVDMRFDTYYGSYYSAYSRAYSDSYYYDESAGPSKKTGGAGHGGFKGSSRKV